MRIPQPDHLLCQTQMLHIAQQFLATDGVFLSLIQMREDLELSHNGYQRDDD